MITILCGGSRGDVQPYIALAMELKRSGREVRIAVTRDHAAFVRSYGVDVFSVEVDHESLNVDKDMIREASQADNPLKLLFSFHKMKQYGTHMVEHYYAACEGSEAIIYHPGISVGYFAAEKMGIPCILATPFPLNKTRQQTSVILYGKVSSNPIMNTLSQSILQNLLWMTSDASLKPFWREKFGRLPADYGCPFERHRDRRHPVIVSCSSAVFSRPTDWNEHIHQNGYWFLAEQRTFNPPVELVDFLNGGEKPVYVGFGSMAMGAATDHLTDIILEGLALTGQRAILSGLGKNVHLPQTVLAVDNLPHTWLFPKMAVVCHHGGAGTSAAGFRSGVPSIILPFALDQHAWAQRAFELGVGPKPLPIKKLTAEKFAELVAFASQTKIHKQAQELAMKISAENGARDGARVIVDSLEKG